MKNWRLFSSMHELLPYHVQNAWLASFRDLIIPVRAYLIVLPHTVLCMNEWMKEWKNERMNEWIYSLDRKIRQSAKQEHRGTITACAYRCPLLYVFTFLMCETITTIYSPAKLLPICKEKHVHRGCSIVSRRNVRTCSRTFDSVIVELWRRMANSNSGRRSSRTSVVFRVL